MNDHPRNRWQRRMAPAVLAISATACSIPFQDAELLQTNTCQSSDECGAGAACVTVGGTSMCVTSKADLPGLLLEVRPSTQASGQASSQPFLIDLADQGILLQNAAIGTLSFSPALPSPVRISKGTVQCISDASSIPAHIEFARVAPFAGLSSKPAVADAIQMGSDPAFSFETELPPGTYDIYVEPAEGTTCGGFALPPVLIPEKAIAVDSTFQLDVEPPRHLTGQITAPSGMSLQGWTLQVIDLNKGRLISDIQTIEQPDTNIPANISVHYNLTPGVTPLLKLSPPADVIAPTVFWDLAAIDLQGLNVVMLALSNLALAPREVAGHVFSQNAEPIIAALTFHSKGLSGNAFKNAAYTLATETGPDGVFQNIALPPGTYRVMAQPLDDDTKAIGEVEWKIEDDPQNCFCGQVVSLSDKVILEGNVSTPTQGAVQNADVVVNPALPKPTPYLDRELSGPPFLPREATAFIDSGSFSLPLDPGEIDLSVRPKSTSGFPWLVRHRLNVQAGADGNFSSLGDIRVPHPLVMTGTIADAAGNPMPSTTVRAWLPVADESGVSKTAIQIAETVSDDQGHYRLLLPPSIAP